MPLNVPTDVLAAARAGDVAGLERVLELAWPHAFRIARSVVCDDGAAEDAAQEACAVAYRRIATLRDPASFRAWFYRIVVREARAVARKVPRNEPLEVLADRQTGLDGVDLDMRRALSLLPWNMRTALVLRYYGDLNSKEIGTALGIPSATVRFRLAQALRRMRVLLAEPDARASIRHEVIL